MSTNLDTVLKTCRERGIPVTAAEEKIIRRRLAKPGAQYSKDLIDGAVPDGVDPLAGTERDPVAAVERTLDERAGMGSRAFTTYPPVASLFPQPEPERAPEPEKAAEKLPEKAVV